MKRLTFTLFLIPLSFFLFSQKESLNLSVYSGFSSYNEYLAKKEVKEWLKEEYSNTVVFIFWPIREIPAVKFYTSYTVPIGGRIAYNVTDKLLVGAELNYTRVEVKANFDFENRSLIFSNERYSLVPFIIYRPNPKALKKFGIDFYFIYGLGYRYSEKRFTTIENEAIVLEKIENGFPYQFKVGAGLSYFPIKPVGIQLELGSGMTNVQIGLVFRTWGKEDYEIYSPKRY